jgi:hypothetical protein
MIYIFIIPTLALQIKDPPTGHFNYFFIFIIAGDSYYQNLFIYFINYVSFLINGPPLQIGHSTGQWRFDY